MRDDADAVRREQIVVIDRGGIATGGPLEAEPRPGDDPEVLFGPIETDRAAMRESLKHFPRLDQAKMQEEMNSAMALNETVGDDVPTFNEVQQKIEARYAKAKASSELSSVIGEGSILEIEQATTNIEAQSRLSQMRAQLGIDGGSRRAAGRRRAGSASAISAAPADAGVRQTPRTSRPAQPGT